MGVSCLGVPYSQGHLCDHYVISCITWTRQEAGSASKKWPWVTIFGQDLQVPGFLRAWILADFAKWEHRLWEGWGGLGVDHGRGLISLPPASQPTAHAAAVPSLSPSPTPSLCPRGLLPPPPKTFTGTTGHYTLKTTLQRRGGKYFYPHCTEGKEAQRNG